MAEIKIYADHELLMRAAAEHFVSLYEAAVADHQHFSVALSGGSTPKTLYELLKEEMFNRYIDWSLVHVFWGDERCVPPDHADSNYHMTRLALLDAVDLPLTNIHRMHGEDAPEQAALDYEKALHDFFGQGEEVRLDLILLGMGDDGHTASLFPETEALDEVDRLVVANYVPKLEAWRITLTTKAINAAHHVAFLVSGHAKASVLQEVLEGPRQARELPSQLINPTSGGLTWFLDADAAQLLSRTI
ncbi:MAG: 6-phosphogluconolactonase [Anaerolineae bacterium]|nr:6-phosphogluconolactonase [Anaerolineae bacterium]